LPAAFEFLPLFEIRKQKQLRENERSGFRENVDHVTKVHFLKFDLVKPVFHFRMSRRPKAL